MSGALLDLVRMNAPLLMMVIPFGGAALMLLNGSARLAWFIACGAAVAASVVGIDFAARLLSGATPALAIVAPQIHVDGVGAFAGALIGLALVLAVAAIGASLKDAGVREAPVALALVLCGAGSWIGALMAGDLIALIVAVETGWLAAVGLVAVNAVRERAPLNGALRMLSIGSIGTALMLLGAAMIGRASGGLSLEALPLAHISMINLAGAGAALVVLGLAVKIGVAPLHAWAAATLGRGNAMVTFGVGVLGVLGAASVLCRFASYAITAPEIGAAISAALAGLGAVSVVVGSVQAVGARNLQRLAAYAGVSQVGCVLLSVALGSPAGFAAALIQLVGFAAAATAFYGGAAAGRVKSLAMLDGYGQRAPLASAAIATGALSLMGAPLTIGFLGRWRLVEAGVGAGWWWASVLVIVASLAGVFYGGRLIERMYFRRANAAYAGDGGVWRVALGPALIAAIVAIGIGFAPLVLLRAADVASGMLTGVAT
ncbi:MAG: proton-conducting transporter membrane subunit [Hyphomonadaceae bacterium]